MPAETINFYQPEQSFDFNRLAVRNKIQLEVADTLGISKVDRADWMYDYSREMREVISSEKFKVCAEQKDWLAARQLIIDQLLEKRAA